MVASNTHRAILVLGMHRSGTSAMTRLINLLGADLGSNLLPPAQDNARGFWEHRGVVDIHEQLLLDLGSNWQDVRSLPTGWLSTTAAMNAREKLVETLQREFSDAPLWAVKDPRLCRLLPLWRVVLGDLNVKPHLVFVVRHPDEVGRSLLARDGIPLAHTRLLWLQHMIEAEEASRGLSRVAISYDDLLRDWRGCAQRMESELKLEWPVSIPEAYLSVEEFLNPGERHHHLGRSDGSLPALAQRAYQCFMAKANGSEGWDRITEVSEIYSASAVIFLDEIRVLEDRIRTTEEQWSLAAKSVVETEASLSVAKAEWGRTADLLRESEAKQLYAVEQWRSTAEGLRTTRTEAEQTRVKLSRSEELLRDAVHEKQLLEAQLSELKDIHQSTMARVGHLELTLRSIMTERGELARDRDCLQMRVNVLERRQRWALRGGAVAVLMAAVAAFCFRVI